MNFASEFVLAIEEDEYESMCEDEFEEGMHISDSDSDEDTVPQPRGLHQRVLAFAGKTKSGGKKQALKYQWKRKGGGPEEVEGGAAPRSFPGNGEASKGKSRTRRFRKADTNVVSVDFDTLLTPSNMFAGDPTTCPECSAILSHISQLEEGTDNKTWRYCEFCGFEVSADLEPEEVPGSEDVTYLLSPAPATANSTLAGQDRSLVVFCVDTSGSMCVTSEISGNVKLRGTNQLRRLQSFREDDSDQFLPSQTDRRVTYVSRLQAMQAAVDSQLTEMAAKHPERRVALVAFNNEVTIMGDGTQTEAVVAGDKLKDADQLRQVAQQAALPQAIKNTQKSLGDKVYSLEEGGATALGPALVLSINLAAAHPGSKVILCTDGKANIGLGRLEVDHGENGLEAEEQALEFYTKTAEEAANKGVTVSVITIQGTDCKLVHLGALADKTGGQVNIVDCLKLTEEFGNILADPIIATKVKATFLLHKELYVVDDDDPDNQASRAEKNIGNVKKSSSITFEFAKRRSKKESSDRQQNGKAIQPVNQESGAEPVIEGAAAASTVSASSSHVSDKKMMEFPFQLQIEYVDFEGNKALRVVTRSLPATTDRKLTEEAVNLEVLGAHAAQKSADLALQGKYSRSRGVALMNQRLAWRQVHSDRPSKASKTVYKSIFSKIKSMENAVQQKQMKEISEFGRTRSDSSSDDDDEEEVLAVEVPRALSSPPARRPAPLGRMQPAKKKASKSYIASKYKKMHTERSSEMDDDMANVMYRFRGKGAVQISEPGSSTDQSQPGTASKDSTSNK